MIARWRRLVLVCGVAIVACEARADELLTLAQALAMAKEHHPTVDAQRAEVEIAHARTEQALARMTPALIGSFGYAPQTANYAVTPAITHQLATTSGVDTVTDTRGAPVAVSCRTPGTGNCTSVSAPPVSWALDNYWLADIGITWTLWDWGHSIYGVRSARSLRRAAEVGVRTAQRDVVLNAKLAYFGVVAALAQVAAAQESVDTNGRHLDQIRAFHTSGLRTGIDVATAESALANADVTLTRAMASLKTAEAQLMFAIGVEEWKDWRLEGAAVLFTPTENDRERARQPDTRLIDAGLAQRSELQNLRLTDAAYAFDRKGARGQYLPQLSLMLGPSWGGGTLDNMVPNFSALLAIGYPVGGMNPLAVHGETREAKGQSAQISAQLRAERIAVRQEVVTARALLTAALSETVAAQTLVTAATKQRELAEGRYASGVGNIIELADALLNFVNARFSAIQAGYDLASARARLVHALGEDG